MRDDLHENLNKNQLEPTDSFFDGFVLLAFGTFLLNLIFGVIALTITGFIIYFFLAAAGVVPPIDYIPFIPNV